MLLSTLAALAVGLAAGPWPALPAASLLWRVPLVAACLVIAWPRLGRVRAVIAALAVAALALDGALPAAREPTRWAKQASEEVLGLQRRLASLAERPELRSVLEAGGAEAAPETSFDVLRRGALACDLEATALLLVDERGGPIAWIGDRPQMPLRLRLLGERAVAAEPGVSEAWVWWREPVLEGGRIIGELLAGVVLPEAGGRKALGVAAGRAAVVVPRWEGGATVASPAGARLFGVDILPYVPAPWSTPGMAAVLVALALAAAGSGALRGGLVLCAIALAVAATGAGPEWWAVLLLATFGVCLGIARARVASRTGASGPALWSLSLLGAALVAALARIGVGLLATHRLDASPDGLLQPTAWQAALAFAWVLVFLSAVPTSPGRHQVLRALAWVPLVAGALLAEPWLVAAGAGAVALFGLPAGTLLLPGVAAALVIAGSDDAARRTALTAVVDSTLTQLAEERGPARALLASVPESGLAELVRLSPGEMVVVLGRVAGWLGFAEALPEGSLAVIDPSQNAVAVWGQHFGGWDVSPRELGTRELPGGWRLSVLAAERPYNVLAALAAAGISVPTAAFDRSGAPVARGATFKPLAPDRVGRALAEGRSWSRIGVGEREFHAFLKAYESWVIAVPWVRQPLPELGLSLAGLSLLGALPFAVWRQRRWARDAWTQRRTFAWRLRALSAAATLVPLLLLAQLLPRQWASQQQRARLELGRALSQPLGVSGIDEQVPWLVRDMGATVAFYRDGRLLWCSRPDLVAAGAVPWLAPEEAFVRAVRGWREPLVTGDSLISVFAPMPSTQAAEVGAVLELQVGKGLRSSTPREWFVITGVWAAVLALIMAERVGRRLGQPLRHLVQAVHRLERGEPVSGLQAQGDEEFVTLTRAFQEMADTVQRREDEIRRERDLLDRVMGALSAAVVVVDATGSSELANASARRLLGESGQLAALERRFGPAVAALLARAAAGESAVETLRPPAAAEEVWQVTVMPLTGMRGRRLVVMEDLSEMARAERLASLAELARIVAHEVKNPLTPIRLWAEELQAAIEGDAPRVVEIARTAAAQILDRVEHLREVAQGFSNLVALERWERAPVVLGSLLRRVAGEYEVAAQRGVSIHQEVAGEGRILADSAWVERAIRHLLDNSLRAIGPRQGEVWLQVADEGDDVVLRIRDTGGGVPEANLGRLFEPHFSTTSEGSGLGLAVVWRVMERAGGRAEARNVKGGLEVALAFPGVANGGDTV